MIRGVIFGSEECSDLDIIPAFDLGAAILDALAQLQHWIED